MKLLEVKNLTKEYGQKGAKVKALDDINFSVEKGEFVAIVGASGSGKSTLIHLLGGVDKPTSGEVVIDGTSIYKLNDEKLAIFRRRQISLIYQFYNLIPILNIRENIELPVLLDGLKVDQEYLMNLVELLKLGHRLEHLPNELSGGEQQRVAIARSLVSKPSLLLADEPTGNLDSKNGFETIELLKKSNKLYNQTIVMITHDEKLALEADRIITIKDGKIIDDRKVR